MLKSKLILCLLLVQTLTYSQSYITALGIRTGNTLGISLQQKLINKFTLELIYQPSTRRNNEGFYSAIEYHKKIITRGFNIYGGAGIHFLNVKDRLNTNPLGMNFIAGIELSLWRLNLSADFIPVVYLKNSDYLFEYSSGVSIRYIIFKPKKKNWFDKLRRK